jgi:hypothetical protein
MARIRGSDYAGEYAEVGKKWWVFVCMCWGQGTASVRVSQWDGIVKERGGRVDEIRGASDKQIDVGTRIRKDCAVQHGRNEMRMDKFRRRFNDAVIFSQDIKKSKSSEKRTQT